MARAAAVMMVWSGRRCRPWVVFTEAPRGVTGWFGEPTGRRPITHGQLRASDATCSGGAQSRALKYVYRVRKYLLDCIVRVRRSCPPRPGRESG